MRIESFDGEFDFLSNFFMIPVIHHGRVWSSSEHAFQAAKTLSSREKLLISTMETPGRAKRAGQQVTKRPDWDEIKVDVMLDVLRAKFGQNPSLAERLLATDDALLIEGNNWGDKFWGVLVATDEGENWLGRLLMKVREEHRGSPECNFCGATQDLKLITSGVFEVPGLYLEPGHVSQMRIGEDRDEDWENWVLKTYINRVDILELIDDCAFEIGDGPEDWAQGEIILKLQAQHGALVVDGYAGADAYYLLIWRDGRVAWAVESGRLIEDAELDISENEGMRDYLIPHARFRGGS